MAAPSGSNAVTSQLAVEVVRAATSGDNARLSNLPIEVIRTATSTAAARTSNLVLEVIVPNSSQLAARVSQVVLEVVIPAPPSTFTTFTTSISEGSDTAAASFPSTSAVSVSITDGADAATASLVAPASSSIFAPIIEGSDTVLSSFGGMVPTFGGMLGGISLGTALLAGPVPVPIAVPSSVLAGTSTEAEDLCDSSFIGSPTFSCPATEAPDLPSAILVAAAPVASFTSAITEMADTATASLLAVGPAATLDSATTEMADTAASNFFTFAPLTTGFISTLTEASDFAAAVIMVYPVFSSALIELPDAASASLLAKLPEFNTAAIELADLVSSILLSGYSRFSLSVVENADSAISEWNSIAPPAWFTSASHERGDIVFYADTPALDLGRFRRGDMVIIPLDLHQVPDQAPTAWILSAADSHTLAVAAMPSPDFKRLSFRLPIYISMAYDLGVYTANLAATVGGSTSSVGSVRWTVVPGGDSGGAVISLAEYARPEATYVIAQLQSGNLVQGRNPTI